MKRVRFFPSIGLLLAYASIAAAEHFPRPAALEPDITFWERIYSEVGTDAGLLHDTHDLSIVYEVVKLPSGLSPRARERHTDALKQRYRNILEKLSRGPRSDLSREERRVLALFEPGVSSSALLEASGRIRFQLGQANKFRAGIIRSGAYKPHVLAALREMNLPLEIAHLPHVESSYTPTVYSRVGAAGLWQFTRSTGRRFMRVDHVVDERLDPYRASLAAARLLEQNHRVTGSWPLAITAYNHGASGMRRAVRSVGTRDIVQIVRGYRSRSFGFASRNFYVEFLAADHVASNFEHYFGPLVLDQPIAFETIELPFYARSQDLAEAIGVDLDLLEEANPALRSAVWQGAKYIPKGFELRVPRAALPRPLTQGVAAVPPTARFARQTQDTHYTVQRGDTLSTIARRHGVRIRELVALNGLASQHRIHVGQKIRLPSDGSPATRTVAYTPSPTPSSTPSSTPSPAAVRTVTPETTPEPLPATGSYTVRRGDNLTRIAQRFGLSVDRLVALNDLHSQHRITAGQRLRVSQAGSQIAEAPELAATHPDAVVALSPARSAEDAPEPSDLTEGEAGFEIDDLPSEIAEARLADESEIEPSPGLLADPSDYTVASDGTIVVQPNETLGHYAEWLGLRASRLRQINGLRFGQPVAVQQRLRLDLAHVRPAEFERIRIEYHRVLQEEFFARWEIEGTEVYHVGQGESLWVLANRRLNVPIWLLRQYNPDTDLDSLTTGTPLTVPQLRARGDQTSEAHGPLAQQTSAG